MGISALILTTLLLLCASAHGRCWRARRGNWAFIPCEGRVNNADPTARVFNGRLYVYTSWDHSRACGRRWRGKKRGFRSFCMVGYRAYSTSDPNLRRGWRAHGPVMHEESVPWLFRGGRGWRSSARMWAPDVIQGDDKRFYMFYPAPRYSMNEMHIGVAVARRPQGPFYPRRFPIRGARGIDPSVVKLPNGRWMLFGSGKGTELWAAFIDRGFWRVGKQHILRGLKGGYKEGPHVQSRNGRLLLYYAISQRGGYRILQAGARNKNNPHWGFWHAGVAIERFDGRTNHGSLVTYKGRHWAFYHRHMEGYRARWTARKVIFSPAKLTWWGRQRTIYPTRCSDDDCEFTVALP